MRWGGGGLCIRAFELRKVLSSEGGKGKLNEKGASDGWGSYLIKHWLDFVILFCVDGGSDSTKAVERRNGVAKFFRINGKRTSLMGVIARENKN